MGRAWYESGVVGRRGVLSGLLAIAVVGGAAAGPSPVMAPDSVVRELSGQAIAALGATIGRPQERRQEVERLLGQGFDLERISQLVLGKYSRAATAAELEEYRRLFRVFVLEAYGSRLDQYGKQELRIVGAQPIGQDSMVESYVHGLAGGATVRLDWRLRQDERGWKVIDLVIEGVSMVVTQRNEFSAIIERGGGKVSALLGHLRDRLKMAALD